MPLKRAKGRNPLLADGGRLSKSSLVSSSVRMRWLWVPVGVHRPGVEFWSGAMCEARFTPPQDRIGWTYKGQQSSKFWSKPPGTGRNLHFLPRTNSKNPAVSTRISNFVDFCVLYLRCLRDDFGASYHWWPLSYRLLHELYALLPDEDGVCMRLVCLSFDAIGSILLHLVNSSLSLSEVPPSWKHSLVCPIFKSGDHSNPSNYSPIAIVSTVAKIVERAVQQQLYGYLSCNHLLSSSQHGFRLGHT